MSRAMRIGLVVGVGLLLAGCQDKPSAPAAPASTQAAATAAPAGAKGDVPTEEDFEDEAEKEITSANLDSEIDKLDKEIGH